MLSCREMDRVDHGPPWMKSASLVCHRVADAELQGDRSSWSCKGSFLKDDDSTAAAMEGHQNVHWCQEKVGEDRHMCTRSSRGLLWDDEVDGNSNLGVKDLILTTEDDDSDTCAGWIDQQNNNMNDEDGSSYAASGGGDSNFDDHSLKKKKRGRNGSSSKNKYRGVVKMMNVGDSRAVQKAELDY
ncbi:hypothetical protein AHAS_Ahas15G0279300 [Arachis hypogaea]